MAGCYGNDMEDRHFESLLHKYLDEQYGAMDAHELRIAQLWETANDTGGRSQPGEGKAVRNGGEGRQG